MILEIPVYDTKLHMVKFRGVWSTILLPLLSDPLWPRVIVPVKVLSVAQINLFENYLYLIGILETNYLPDYYY